MGLTWKKASYGKTTSGRSGGRCTFVATEGNKGIPAGGKYPKKGSLSGSILDKPGAKGDRGLPGTGGYPKAKAPKD